MKCRYRLTDRAKSNLKLTLIISMIPPITILGVFSIIMAMIYPFADTTKDSILIDISSWSVYIVTLATTLKYSWEWLKENTEECE